MSFGPDIQAIALEKKIPFLVHFTRAENLPSIMKHGLLPVQLARERGIEQLINDTQRLDGRLNGTSLSVAFPNGQMFFKLRNENPDTRWTVLAIANSVAWSKPVYFASTMRQTLELVEFLPKSCARRELSERCTMRSMGTHQEPIRV